jgi:hypothetical protein
MSAVALPELSDRVEQLAQELDELRNTPQDTIGTTNTYLMKTITGMNWLGGWNREDAYEPENVVRYKGRSYVNIAPVPAFPAPGILPPPKGSFAATQLANFPQNATAISQYIDEAEEIEDLLLPTSVRLPTTFSGQSVGKLYQFRTPNGAKVSLPADPEVLPEHWVCHYELYNSNGERLLGNAPSIKEFAVVGGADPTLFFLLVIAVNENGPMPITAPVPYLLKLTSSGGFTNEPGNAPPSSDPTHWALISGAASTSTATTTEVKGELVLPAGGPGVLAKLEPNVTDWDVSGWWNPATHRYTPGLAGIYSVSVAFQGLETVPSGGWTDVAASKNGTSLGNIYARNMSSSASAGPEGGCTGYVNMNGSTDFLEVWGGAHTGGGASVKGIVFLAIDYVGPAK